MLSSSTLSRKDWTAALGVVLAGALLVVAGTAASGTPVSGKSAGLLAGALVATAAVLGGVSALRNRATESLIVLYLFLTPFQFAAFGSSLLPRQHETAFGFRLSLSDFVFPILLLALLQQRVEYRSFLRSRAGMLFFGLVLALAASWAQSALHLGSVTRFSTGKFIGLVYLTVLAAVLVDLLRDPPTWARAIDALAIGGVASGVIGIAGWLLWTFGGVSTYLVNFDRVNSTMFGDPNIFGSLMAVTLILSVVRVATASRASRVLWVAFAGVALVALVLSQSRSGSLAAIVGLLSLGLWYRPSAVLVVMACLALLSTTVWAGFASIGPSSEPAAIAASPRLSDETLTSRLTFWERGARLLPREALPGIGIGVFEQTNFFTGTERVRAGFARAHNTYLAVALELGLTGSIAFVLLGIAAFRAGAQGRRRLGRPHDWRLAGVASCLIGMLAFAFWVDGLYQRHLWILIALVMAIPYHQTHLRECLTESDARPRNEGS